MSTRYFTAEEANALLPEVRPLAERMVARRRSLAELEARRAEIAGRIAGNGGRVDPQALADLEARAAREAAALAQCVERIQALGLLVKDLELGLVDFPAHHEGREVLLCWRVGEEEVAYWHPVDEGFAGRRPLPFT